MNVNSLKYIDTWKAFVLHDSRTLLPCECVFALLITGFLVTWWCIFPRPKRKLHCPQAPRESAWETTVKMQTVSWSEPLTTATLISAADVHVLNSVTEHTKVMHTQMSLHPDEFDYFELRMDSDITFCLKELRVTALFLEPCFKCVFMQITCACDWATPHFWSSWILMVTNAFSKPSHIKSRSL